MAIRPGHPIVTWDSPCLPAHRVAGKRATLAISRELRLFGSAQLNDSIQFSMRSDIHAARPVADRNLPDVDIAVRGIVPRDVAGPIRVEVAGTRRRPPKRMCAHVDAAGPLTVCEFPKIEIARGCVVPGSVAAS